MKKQKATHLCHSCLAELTDDKLFIADVKSSSGPKYSAAICEPCCDSKKIKISSLESFKAYNKRVSLHQGILNK